MIAMAERVNAVQYGSDITSTTATIAKDGTLSGVVNLNGYNKFTIIMPDAWTNAHMTFQACATSGGTFVDLLTEAGAEVDIAVAASGVYPLTTSSAYLSYLPYIKIRSGTTAVPVQQAAARTITIVMKA